MRVSCRQNGVSMIKMKIMKAQSKAAEVERERKAVL